MSSAKYVIQSNSGLRDSDVLEIRQEYSNGGTLSGIASLFGVSAKTVRNIVDGVTWAHVPAPKQLKSFSNYEVYPDGRVRSRAAQKFVTMKSRADGTLLTDLRSGGRRQLVETALLVARAFINSKVRSASSISYLDGNPSNTHFTNLQINSRNSW